MGEKPEKDGDEASGAFAMADRATSRRLSRNMTRKWSRPGRSSLVARTVFPVVLVSLLCGLITVAMLYNAFHGIWRNEFLGETAQAAMSMAVMGRLLITCRDRFILDHPEYPSAGEWRVGDHWLIFNQLIVPEKLAAATGYSLDEYAPKEVLEKAVGQSTLSDMVIWNDLSYDRAKFIAVVILNLDGSVMASMINSDIAFNLHALLAPPRREALRTLGSYRLTADYLVDASGELLARGVAEILQADDGERMGSALVLFHAPGFPDDFLSIVTGLSVFLLVQLCCLALVCWIVSGRHGENVRRLAEDMWGWADGDLSRRAEVRGTAEMALLAEAFNHMGERLCAVWAKERETTRLESDLSVAQKIQKSLMPIHTPDIPGMDIHVICRPAREIGGDYYDFFPIDDRRIGMIVADASGKSIPAALVMSTTRAVIRFVAMSGAGIIETLTRVNSVLGSSIPKGMFVTAFYLVLDIRERSIVCASAGHTPLLIARRDGTIEAINPSGMALGFDAGPVFQNTLREQRVEFHPGDRALLFTDGAIECVNSSHEEYSERRLTEFLRRNRDMGSQDFLGSLVADLDLHRGGEEMLDDTTAMTFRVL